MSWMSKVLSILAATVVVNVLAEMLWLEVGEQLDITTKIINLAWGSLLLGVFLWGTVASIRKA